MRVKNLKTFDQMGSLEEKNETIVHPSTPSTSSSPFDWSLQYGISKDNIFVDQNQIDSDWTTFALDNAAVEEFWKNGFIGPIRILTEQQCDVLQHTLDEHMSGDTCTHPGKDMLYKCSLKKDAANNSNVIHVQGQWRLTQHFHDLVYHPKIVVPCAQLLKQGEMSPLRFFHDQLISKPPKFSGVVGWHQDYSLWIKTGPPSHITVHIALCDQTLDNGCIQYIGGSHRWNRDGKCFYGPDFKFSEDEMDSLKELLNEEELAAFKETPVLLKKGEATIHHSYTVHGSYANRSDGRRVAVVLNYISDGVKSVTDQPILTKTFNPHTQCADFKNGEKLEGKLFPLVFDVNQGGLLPAN